MVTAARMVAVLIEQGLAVDAIAREACATIGTVLRWQRGLSAHSAAATPVTTLREVYDRHRPAPAIRPHRRRPHHRTDPGVAFK